MTFEKRIIDINNNCLNNDKSYLLDFLDLAEQEIVKKTISKSLFLKFDGGYEDSEYKRCYISKYENYDLKVQKLKIKYNKKFLTLNHRHILGRLMSLGIERSCIGDIVIGEDSFIICKKELADFIIDNMRDLDNNSIELIKTDEEISHEEKYEMKDIFVSSIRLDAIVSGSINISRGESAELIKSGFVKINQKVIENTSQNISVCDIISIRKFGRIKVFSINGKTKSGKIVLQIGKLR